MCGEQLLCWMAGTEHVWSHALLDVLLQGCGEGWGLHPVSSVGMRTGDRGRWERRMNCQKCH